MDWYKIAAAVGVLWGIISTVAYVPLRGRIKTIEGRVGDTMSKEEVKEAIELRQQPLVDEVKRLNQNVCKQTDAISTLTSSINDLQRWQDRMVGAGYTNGARSE